MPELRRASLLFRMPRSASSHLCNIVESPGREFRLDRAGFLLTKLCCRMSRPHRALRLAYESAETARKGREQIYEIHPVNVGIENRCRYLSCVVQKGH